MKEAEGTLTIPLKKAKTGLLYIPADLMKDSSFPLEPGKVKIKVEGSRLIVEQA